ncbi:hypothetical protein CEP52_009628, partial [Fusarium oligoseptatum]
MPYNSTSERPWRIVVHHSPSWVTRFLGSLRPSEKGYNVPRLSGPRMPSFEAEGQCQEHTSRFSSGPVISARMTSALILLPDELLLEILKHLQLSSLYMLHQTCRRLRYLSEDHTLKDFRLEFLRSEGESFCMTQAGYHQRLEIRDVLLRRSLCDTCTHLADTGELVRRMRSLYAPLFCYGCRIDHPALFFPPRKERNRKCLGLLGQFSVCAHHALSGKHVRQNAETLLPRKIICKHLAHSPLHFDGRSELFLRSTCHPEIFSPLGRSPVVTKAIVLLHLDHRWRIDMDGLRQSLAAQLKESKQLCKHISSQIPQLLDKLPSEDCSCFPPSGIPASRWIGSSHGPFDHHHEFVCRECGAKFHWIREMDGKRYHRSYIALRMQIMGFTESPLSIGWLSNLDYRGDRNPVLCDKTKGVLWCDKPDCSTGPGLRWLRMAKTFAYEASWEFIWIEMNRKG